MASKKKTVHSTSSRLNFRPFLEKNENRGTKPTAERPSVKNILLMMIQHLCRKLLFIDIHLRIATYLGFIFVFSILVDVLPMPRALSSIGFASKENFLNKYFVKIGWGWTLLVGIPFNALTSFVYCCGKRKRVLKHLGRFAVATFFWYFWTNFYNYIENIFGRCNIKDIRYQTKPSCINKGYFWHSLDISGHCFILLYSTLVLIEECRVINCWEGISDLIREEEHSRSQGSTDSSPLRTLSACEFERLKSSYPKLTPYIRSLFIIITCLVIIWDIMLITTVLFYHNMLEKLLAAITAVVTWYLTYYLWYVNPKILPSPPGDGLFKYRETKQQSVPLKKKGSSTTKVPGPKFMGMPIRVPEENVATQPETTT